MRMRVFMHINLHKYWVGSLYIYTTLPNVFSPFENHMWLSNPRCDGHLFPKYVDEPQLKRLQRTRVERHVEICLYIYKDFNAQNRRYGWGKNEPPVVHKKTRGRRTFHIYDAYLAMSIVTHTPLTNVCHISLLLYRYIYMSVYIYIYIYPSQSLSVYLYINQCTYIHIYTYYSEW